MSRITERDEHGNAKVVQRYSIQRALNKLAAYENMGIPVVDVVTCEKAIIEWGTEAQTDMLIEEMSELTKALLKLRRKQNSRIDYDEPEKNDVAEEIADVIIMLVQQLSILDCYDDVDTIVGAKLRRLKSRLAD